MNRAWMIGLAVMTACAGEPRAQAAPRRSVQSRFPVVCSLVTKAEVERAVGRPVVSLAPQNPKYPTGSCKIDLGGGTSALMRFGPLGSPVANAEALTRELNDDAMTGGGWEALPGFPVPAAGLKAIPIVIAKKGELQLELTGFSMSYEHAKAIMAIAARRLP